MNRVLATIALAGLTTLVSCNSTTNKVEEQPKETKVSKTAKDLESRNSDGLKIAYYIQDSIPNGFKYFREIDSMLKQKEMRYQSKLKAMYAKYEEFAAEVQRRDQNGEISAFDAPKVQKQIQDKQQKIAEVEQNEGAALQQETMNYQSALANKISQAGKEYAEENGIDMLLFYQKGGQITYISDAFDVTGDFIKYLNKRESEIISDVEDTVEDKTSESEK